MPPPLPRCSSSVSSSLISPRRISLPRKGHRVGLHIVLFEACSAFTRVAACTLARSPICDPLSRLFPEELAKIACGTARGVASISPLLELGHLLLTVECVAYFPRVLARLKTGQASAYAEIVLVAALVRNGFPAIFEAGEGCP